MLKVSFLHNGSRNCHTLCSNFDFVDSMLMYINVYVFSRNKLGVDRFNDACVQIHPLRLAERPARKIGRLHWLKREDFTEDNPAGNYQKHV